MPAALTFLLSGATTTLLLLAAAISPGGEPVARWLQAGASQASQAWSSTSGKLVDELERDLPDRNSREARAAPMIGVRLVVGVGGRPLQRDERVVAESLELASRLDGPFATAALAQREGPRAVAAMVETDDEPAYDISQTLAFAAMLQASIVEHQHLAKRHWYRDWFSGAASQGGETARAARTASLEEFAVRPTRQPASGATLVLCWSAALLMVAYLAVRRRG